MQLLRIAILMLCVLGPSAWPEVVPPNQITDPELRRLQEKYLEELAALGDQVREHGFAYHFYFSRRLDVDEKRQRHLDQNSIRFGRFQGNLVLEITGNYYAAYSRKLMDRNHRAVQTYRDVILPVLKAAVHHFQDKPEIDGYALEVSHHVIGNVLGVTMEVPENLFVLLPQTVAQQLTETVDEAEQEKILSNGTILLNGVPVSLSLRTAPPMQ